MATIRRKTKQRQQDFEVLDRFQIRHLLEGHPLLFWKGFKTIGDFAAAWTFHRDVLLPSFIDQHPGHRPFAWWLLEHRQERPVVAAWATPEIAEAHRRIIPDFAFEFLHNDCFQQSERDYLAAAGLLTAAELDALTKDHDDDK
jgi:hypothetical protein